MGTLRYAVLGLLDRNDMTGYELAQEFGDALSEFWSARHSQIYPELKRLGEEGLVEYSTEVSGTQLERKRYHLTPAGKRAFDTWERESRPLSPTPKDEFRLQLFFSDSVDSATRARLIADHLAAHRKRLDHLEENAQAFAPVDELNDRQLSDYMVLRGAIMREEAACAWLTECEEMVRS